MTDFETIQIEILDIEAKATELTLGGEGPIQETFCGFGGCKYG